MRRTERGRGLRAVVFLDTVGSTQIAATLGDERWQTLLRRELQILRKLLKERGGDEVDAAGDGLFALFREPAPAVRYAASTAEAVREIGLEIRAGIHFGEVEFSDGRPAGIVVHTGARAMGTGSAGEVIVTQGVRDLLTGGHLGFEGHGTHELKGVPGTWPLFRLTQVDDKPVVPRLDDEEARTRREDASQLAPLVKRRSFLAGAGVAVVAGGVAAYALTRPKPALSHQHQTLGGERLFRYTPETDELSMMPGIYSSSGFFPSVAFGEGAVWTGDFFLHKVDPDDGSESAPIDLIRGESSFIYGLATDFNEVWVVSGTGIHRIDPGDGDELGYRGLPAGGQSVATGFGSVWVGDVTGTLRRISPSGELPILAEIGVGDLVSGIVATGSEIWVSDEFGTLISVDPSTNVAGEPVPIPGSPKGLAATEDRLWAVDPDAHSVTVVDIETRTPIETVTVGGEPVDVVAGLEAIWVADLRGNIVKVDPAQLKAVERKPIGGPVAALAIDETGASVWARTYHD
jgi:class 3 adenylate cyclase